MPSDSKKRKDAKKKEATKQRGGMKKKDEETNGVTNGDTNGVTNGIAEEIDSVSALAEELDDLVVAAKFRSCTGVLATHQDSRDVHLHNVSIRFHGTELLTDTKMELNVGRRYGLLGLNGCGKSSLLACIGSRELPIPDHVDIFLLRREMAPSDKTALQCVIECDAERLKLEKEAEILSSRSDQESHDRLMDLYERLDDMDASTAEARAAEILWGLGFTKEMQYTKVKDFSGGWRMRISLARALYIKPALLLLDEPTNHLDLNACVWLENELKEYKRILIVVSHSQDFLNGVCNSIIHFNLQKLKYYGGNYDTYVQTRMELEENQMKKYRWEQDQISHMKNYIARFGHGSAKLAKQAQSKEKTLKKMVEKGVSEKVSTDRVLSFYFPPCGKLPPPIIMVQHVSFRYADDKKWIYRNLDFGIDLDTRVALVGPNGAGKSTLLKLILGELVPSDGLIRRHSHVKIGRYHQHLAEILDLDMSAVEWLQKCYPDVKEKEEMRRMIGMYGLTGPQQLCPMKNLSDGQRCRVIFAYIAWQHPHLLLFDEPTNHLDIETIDSLAEAINDFEGGLMLVSHDFRLISQVTEEIWICENETVTKWEGGIYKYKEDLRAQLEKDTMKRKKALGSVVKKK